MSVYLLPRDKQGGAIAALRPYSPQAIAFGATATTTAALNTSIVRISSDIDVHFAYGTAPTAATTDHYLPAKLVEYIGIAVGDLISMRSATSVAAGNLGTFYVSLTR